MTQFLLTPEDLDAHPWVACGPAALAVLAEVPLGDLKACFPKHTEERAWTNFTQMRAALDQLGLDVRNTKPNGPPYSRALCPELPGLWTRQAFLQARCWPDRGLALVQFRGPWDRMPVNHPAQLRHTHWVAVTTQVLEGKALEPMVFDVNVLQAGLNYGWTHKSWWAERVLPSILRRPAHRRATGEWWLRAGLEVGPARRRHVLRVEAGEPSPTGACEVCGSTNASAIEACPGPRPGGARS
jgi:hypothetical protein